MLYKIFRKINYKNFKKLTFYELIVLFFPLFMIIGPAIINFALILCALIFIKELFIKKINFIIFLLAKALRANTFF